jgi:hypothetical protein
VVWGLSIPEVRIYLTPDDEPGKGGRKKQSITDVARTINDSRAKRGLPPLEIRNFKGT